MDAHMVAHVWAQQSQDEARTPRRNFYFSGPTIFSYGSHFPCASFVTDRHGNRVVLVTTRSYSHTTAKHMRYTQSALGGMDVQKYYVHDVSERRNSHLHVTNARQLAEEIVAKGNDFCNMRKAHYQDLNGKLTIINNMTADLARYCDAFSVEYPWHIVNDILIRERILRVDAEYNQPAKQFLRDAGSLKREGRYQRYIAAALAHREGALGPVTYAFIERIPKRLRRQYDLPTYVPRYPREDKWDLYKPREKNNTITPEEWHNGKAGQLEDHYRYGYGTETLLRRKDGRLQTSRGVEVPFQQAVVAYHAAHRCRRKGIEWKRNGATLPVGHFQVDSIDTEGNLKAGCHTLTWDEMHRLAMREIPEQVRPVYPLPAIIN